MSRVAAIGLLAVLAAPPVWAQKAPEGDGLVRLVGVRLVESESNDGDSFAVRAGGRRLHLRLYYVDCPEVSSGRRSDLERIQQQQRYFGLRDVGQVVQFGRRAAAFVADALEQPFVVHTRYARAPGQSGRPRYYAFVQTADGRSLAHLLVERGLARVHGTTRPGPDGTPSDIILNELQDLRDKALLRKAGIWELSDPELLVRMRQHERDNEQALKELQQQLDGKGQCTPGSIDLNRASVSQLQTIKGVGPVTAAQIVAGRPYYRLEDLMDVPGIGPKTLQLISQCARMATWR